MYKSKSLTANEVMLEYVYKISQERNFNMKQKSVHILLMSAAMLFALVSLGGCGGGSSSYVSDKGGVR